MTKNMFHYINCGLDNIWLKNGFTVKETEYGQAVSINNIESLHNLIGLKLVNNKPDLSGADARFLRKELDLSQVSLASLLGVSDSTVRGWENDRSTISKSSEIVLRKIYNEHVSGDGTLRAFIERIAQLNRDNWDNQIEVEEMNESWQMAA